MISKIKTLSSVFAFMLLLTVAAFGQETTGNIEVTVTDPSAARVPGATVRVSSGSTDRTVTTDEQGFVRVQQLPPAIYTVTITAGNFRPASFERVEVVLGKTTPVDAALQAGGITESVVVSASDVAPIDPTDNKIQTNLTAAILEQLPKGTNFSSSLRVAPAVRPEPLSGGFQIDGASGSENSFIIDGQEVTNFRTGTLNTNNNIPFQFVQEVQVKSSGFEAEFGGATGGVINVVTKSGSNDWRGEFGIQFRPAELQAGPRPYLRRFATGSAAAGTFVNIAEYIRPPRDNGTDVFPTANLSGPIVENRLWFFGSFTPQFLNVDRTVPTFTSDPRTRTTTEVNRYRSRQRNDYGFLRLDAAPADTLRLTGTWTWNPIAVRGAVPVQTENFGVPEANFGGNIGFVRGPGFLNLQGGRQNSQNVTGQAVWTPTSNLVLNFRAGRSFLNEKLNSYGIPRATRFLCSATNAGVPAASGCISGQSNFLSNFQIDYDVSIRKTFDADASYLVSDFGGRHQFKFGYQYNGLSNNTRQGYRNEGIVSLHYGLSITDILGLEATPGNIGSGFVQRFATEGAASSNSQSFFIQDSWQPTSRLSLNLGVRFEKENVPSFNGAESITFGLGDKIAPRLGVAFDLTGDGKTKLFASYGWFYDRFKYELPRGSFGGDFFRRDYFELFPQNIVWTSNTVASVIGNNPDPAGGVCEIRGVGVPPPGAPRSRCQLDFRIASNTAADIFHGGQIDPNIKAARQSEFTVGFERDLGRQFVLSSRYTHKQVDRAIEDVGIPTPEGSEAYIIGNPGEGLAREIAEEFGFPSAEAIRKYDAFEVRVDKRFSDNYYFNANYTYSRLFGNYSGLASSDEAGRTSPNVNRFFDLPFLAYDANGNPAVGRLATDRPHVFKFNGSYNLNWRNLFDSPRNSTDFQVFTTIQSGTPLTTFYNAYSAAPVILFGRGDLGRTETYTQTDFAITHTYRFGKSENKQFKIDLNILNLFNESNVLTHQTTISPTNFSAGTAFNSTTPVFPGIHDEVEWINAIFNGGLQDEIVSFINSRADRRFNTYNLPNGFQAGRDIRFGFRFLF